jgi:acylglycerol lipase
MDEESFDGVKGVRLFARSWRPEGPAKGAVAMVHGFKAHSGLFEWPARQLAARGYACYALDLRGHGKSEGERDYVADYIGDLEKFIARVKSREPGLLVFLLGHSAGGVLSTYYTLEHQEELAGLISESFAYEVAPELALTAIKGISRIAPRLHVLNLKDKYFSRDPKFVAAMMSDPLIVHASYPAHTVAEMARANERLTREIPSIALPVLILHGTADKVTRPSGSQHFFNRVGSTDKNLRLYGGHFHDLLNDLEREEVMGNITEWIEQRTPAREEAPRA